MFQRRLGTLRAVPWSSSGPDSATTKKAPKVWTLDEPRPALEGCQVWGPTRAQGHEPEPDGRQETASELKTHADWFFSSSTFALVFSIQFYPGDVNISVH